MENSKSELQMYTTTQVVSNEYLNSVFNAEEMAIKNTIMSLINNTLLSDLEKVFNINISYLTSIYGIDVSRKEIAVGYKSK